MTVPSSITTAVTNLAATQSTLGPFLQASVAARLAFEQQIAALDALIDSTIVTLPGLLDSQFSGDSLPIKTISDFTSLYQSSSDQYTLAALRGVIGRMLLNVSIAYNGGPIPLTYIAAQPSLDFSKPLDTQYIPGLL